MLRFFRLFVTLAILLLTSGCSSEGLSLVGKECPCVQGYYCDTITNLCVKGSPPQLSDAGHDSIQDSETPNDGSASDSGSDATTNLPCDPGFIYEPAQIGTWELNFEAGQALTNVELHITEQGNTLTVEPLDVGPAPEYVLTWSIDLITSTTLDITIVADPSQTVYGSCQVFVAP